MARLEEELRAYAEELSRSLPGETGSEAYEELLRGIYEAMVRHHGEETMERMSEETIVKVIRSQVGELIRLKRIGKLLNKRDRI